MALYERLMGILSESSQDKIPVHIFNATMNEFGRSAINGATAQTIINASSGSPLTPAEVTEANALLATITGAGGATGRMTRAKLIEDVLMLAEHRVPGYDTVALVKARLGVT